MRICSMSERVRECTRLQRMWTVAFQLPCGNVFWDEMEYYEELT